MNQQLIASMLEHSEIITEKCIKLQSHILNAHQIWNYRIEQKEGHFAVWQIHPVATWKDIDQNNFQSSLQILNKVDLNDKIQYKTSQGQAFTNSVRDIFFHVINHSTYHRGQLASEFKQAGIEPIVTDYIFYKR